MRTKILSSILLTTFLLLATVSATVTFTVNPSTLVFTQATNSAEITLTNTGNETATFTLPSNIQISDGTDVATVILNKYTLSLDSGASSNLSASVNPSGIDKLDVGIYTINADIKAINTTSGENSTQTLTFSIHKSYCEKGPLNLSTIEIKSVDESGSSSDSDWTWYPQDNITLEVKVKNNDDDTDRTVRIEWDIYDTEAKEFLDIGDDDTLSIDSNEDETAEFTFEVPYDLARGSNYILYIKAYDDDDGEDKICSVAKDDGRSALLGEEEGISLEIKRDSHDVQVTKTNIPELLSCGSTSDIGLWVANLGRSREEKIKVTLLKSVFSEEISREISKLDWDDKAEEVSFPITVPKDLEEKEYKLNFKIESDYDKDKDEYAIEDTMSYTIEVKGNCVAEQKQAAALITAELDSDAIAGEQLIIKGTLKNTGTATTTYDLSAVDYDSWATLDRIDTRSVTLDAGKSKDFSLYFTIKDNAKGEQFFTIKAVVSGTETTEQEVSVMVEQKETEVISGITGATITEHLRENWFIWVIVVINIVLIIAIILVARRIVAAK